MGLVDDATIERFQNEAKEFSRAFWWLSNLMDDSIEEKVLDRTIEVGRAHFNTKTKRFTMFDAPGHKSYLPNLIMGASCADIGGLVISARRGEFEAGFNRKGLTKEHVHLAKSLGIQKLVVIVNKMDDPTVDWAEERY